MSSWVWNLSVLVPQLTDYLPLGIDGKPFIDLALPNLAAKTCFNCLLMLPLAIQHNVMSRTKVRVEADLTRDRSSPQPELPLWLWLWLATSHCAADHRSYAAIPPTTITFMTVPRTLAGRLRHAPPPGGAVSIRHTCLHTQKCRTVRIVD